VFRWIDHTSELELELESESEDGVFIDALEALRELLEEDTDAGEGAIAEYVVRVERDGRDEQLADWVGQLARLAEDDGFVADRIAAIALTDGGLEATVEGRCGSPASLVRSVAQTGLLYEPAHESHRFHARVTVLVSRPGAPA
jgi:hypothetical protein